VKRIRTRLGYDKACSRIEHLFSANGNSPEMAELKKLVAKVEDYEDRRFPIKMQCGMGSTKRIIFTEAEENKLQAVVFNKTEIINEYCNLVGSSHEGFIPGDKEFKPCQEGCKQAILCVRKALDFLPDDYTCEISVEEERYGMSWLLDEDDG